MPKEVSVDEIRGLIGRSATLVDVLPEAELARAFPPPEA